MPATQPAFAASRLVFPGPRQVLCERFIPTEPGTGEVRVRARWSLMSTGTESIVFARRFAPGTHWDHWVKYPFHPGYALVGEVERLGAGVSGLAVGDLVVGRCSHASHHVGPAAAFARIPSGVDPRHAAWFALAKITAIGARAIGYTLGDDVLVIGAGPIGQMSVRWAVAGGAERVVALDPSAGRLPAARAGGAAATIAAPVDSAGDAVRAAFDGRMPNVVVDATGHAPVLMPALSLAAYRGRVLVMGDTGTPGEQRMSSDLIAKGLTIRAAHDGHEEPGWDAARYYRLFFSLVGSGRFRMDGLDTEAFAPGACAEAYARAEEKRGETMGILFDWSRA
jgi:2-desacetyl-2-hydroxyethyl bacteriochlorophyllide A dehydrogenase